MSRDMKPRKHSKATARRRSGGGMLVGIFVGLVLGVLCAAGVVWYIFKTPPPFSNKGQPSPSTAQQAGATVAPLALPGKPGDPVPQNGDKPRFDFYKILPGNAEAIPDPKPTEVVKDKGEKENMLKESVYLQTGSFQNVDDADNQKTKLALMGVEASVQQVMLQDRVWYRVRLGPFRKMDEVNNMRSDLAKQGIEASLVRKD
ncbi:MAG: SPOR domain-containing protein [Propionivibrio sp.]|nr:SPOR domain-containing protein [Propionivibrio sp.]MBK9026936.1 SPOR domain-containing protein [Propionivibrio sp.]MBP6422113.1 SPOR domain-containing protein [Propionivibrio sp.]